MRDQGIELKELIVPLAPPVDNHTLLGMLDTLSITILYQHAYEGSLFPLIHYANLKELTAEVENHLESSAFIHYIKALRFVPSAQKQKVILQLLKLNIKHSHPEMIRTINKLLPLSTVGSEELLKVCMDNIRECSDHKAITVICKILNEFPMSKLRTQAKIFLLNESRLSSNTPARTACLDLCLLDFSSSFMSTAKKYQSAPITLMKIFKWATTHRIPEEEHRLLIVFLNNILESYPSDHEISEITFKLFDVIVMKFQKRDRFSMLLYQFMAQSIPGRYMMLTHCSQAFILSASYTTEPFIQELLKTLLGSDDVSSDSAIYRAITHHRIKETGPYKVLHAHLQYSNSGREAVCHQVTEYLEAYTQTKQCARLAALLDINMTNAQDLLLIT